MNASDIMSQHVISIRPDHTVEEAVRLMLQDGISGLPVVDASHKLVGILTEGDLIRRSEIGTGKHHPRWIEFILGPAILADEYVQANARYVSEVMTRDVIAVTEETPLDEIARIMERRRVKRLPVVRGEIIVGMISRADLLRAVASNYVASSPVSRSDIEIRGQISTELAKQPWAGHGISVVVKDGMVDLWGVVFSASEQKAIRLVAENVSGVSAVRDHLVLVDPFSGMVMGAITN